MMELNLTDDQRMALLRMGYCETIHNEQWSKPVAYNRLVVCVRKGDKAPSVSYVGAPKGKFVTWDSKMLFESNDGATDALVDEIREAELMVTVRGYPNSREEFIDLSLSSYSVSRQLLL